MLLRAGLWKLSKRFSTWFTKRTTPLARWYKSVRRLGSETVSWGQCYDFETFSPKQLTRIGD
jgi:hypothetical protein